LTRHQFAPKFQQIRPRVGTLDRRPGAPHAPEDDPAALRAALGMLERTERSTKLRWRIECAFNRLKDFRRIATRYDRLARNYLASVCLAAALVWWI
jgi:hypothetical protein